MDLATRLTRIRDAGFGRAMARASTYTIAAALAFTLAIPQAAMAWRAPDDRIGGAPLAKADVATEAAPDIDAAAGILMDADGRVLWSRRGDERRPMASTTKIMTGLLVAENAEPDERVTVSKEAAGTPYGIGLKAGEKTTVRRLLELALVASSNDAAYALGEHVGGDMDSFVDMMNTRADELGLENTHFSNPHGLDAKGHYSSPEDLAELAQTAMDEPEFRRAVGLKTAKLPAYKGRAARTLKSTDKLLGTYKGLDGVKTGFTGDAGYCFVGNATRHRVELTAVVLGAGRGNSRFAQTSRLLDWGFRNTKVEKIASAGEIVGEVPISADPERIVPVRLGESATARVFGLDGPVTREPSLPERIDLPVIEGQKLGEVELKQGDRVLAKVPAVAAASTIAVEQTVGAVPVSDYLDRAVAARALEVTAPVEGLDPEAPVERRIDLEPRVTAPIDAGDRLGEIAYTQGDRVVARVPVVAAESVDAPDLLGNLRTALMRAWRGLVGGPTMAELEVLGS